MKDQKTPEETIYESAAYKFLREKLGSHNTPTFARIAEIMQEYADLSLEIKSKIDKTPIAL